MRSAAAAAVALSICNSGGESSPPPEYTCAHMFDDGCRYEAEVTWDEATLTQADILWGNGVTSMQCTIEDLSATVRITDLQGIYADVTCTLSADLLLDATRLDGETDASWVVVHALDPSCPVDCPWFLPTSGTFQDGAGRFGLGWFEGQFDLEWGPTGSDPSYSEITVPFGLADSDFDDGQIVLLEPAPAYATSYRVPMALTGANTISTCTP